LEEARVGGYSVGLGELDGFIHITMATIHSSAIQRIMHQRITHLGSTHIMGFTHGGGRVRCLGSGIHTGRITTAHTTYTT